MKVELPRGPLTTALMYICVGCCLFSAPNILQHLNFISSKEELGLLKMIGMLISFGGLFAAFLAAFDDENKK